VDPVLAQEAVTLALGEAIERAASGSTLRAEADAAANDMVRIVVRGDAPVPASIPLQLAEALLRAQGSTLRSDADGLAIELPAERGRRTPP
jgi:hypothetical protein